MYRLLFPHFIDRSHSEDIGAFGAHYIGNTHKVEGFLYFFFFFFFFFYKLIFNIFIYNQPPNQKNVDSLANAYSFERSYERLLSVERTLKAESSGPILACMRLADDTLTKHNFYVDKFDCTAWNDFDAIPRAASQFGLTDHGGSRKRLLFSRRQVWDR